MFLQRCVNISFYALHFPVIKYKGKRALSFYCSKHSPAPYLFCALKLVLASFSAAKNCNKRKMCKTHKNTTLYSWMVICSFLSIRMFRTILKMFKNFLIQKIPEKFNLVFQICLGSFCSCSNFENKCQ
jgi:hypothetical protein